MTALVMQRIQNLLRGANRTVQARSAFGGDRGEPVSVYTAANTLEADLVKALLDSEGIQAYAAGEAVGNVYGLQFGPLAQVDIFVARALAPRARQIVEERHLGYAEAEAE